MTLTPKKYWRIAKTVTQLAVPPEREMELPNALAVQKAPPTMGDGILLADYDSTAETGVVRYLGIIRRKKLAVLEVDWQATNTEIWVDTPAGRGNWKNKPGFRFATTKIAGYGLHQLFASMFPDLQVREELPQGTRPSSKARRKLPTERLEPIEVIGVCNDAPTGGYVYVLDSAYGYKVGRTRSIPSRMQTFAVKLPFMYTIPFCVWFDDHIEAEAAYHRHFSGKRINGEWFDLNEADLEKIRARDYK